MGKGSKYYWDTGLDRGSKYYWKTGNQAGSKYFWKKGSGKSVIYLEDGGIILFVPSFK